MTTEQILDSVRSNIESFTDSDVNRLYLIVEAVRAKRGLDVESTHITHPKWMSAPILEILSVIEAEAGGRGISIDKHSFAELGKYNGKYKNILEDFLTTTMHLTDTNKVKRAPPAPPYNFNDFLRALTALQVHRTINYCRLTAKPYPVTYGAYIANMRTIGSYLNRKYPAYASSGLLAFAIFPDITADAACSALE